ncbi:ROK family transcriptional regulator [Streptomyces abyssalis]|uniref:ROK family transcriptional regulator n=1 Tax=Streptomyces abyssalis TaxID=933944 RepID=A0A1E7JSJ4_9ACTN|nr:class I mannose-6-phosphate isomerase [Streptomyces abyssalis]OEU91826.1 ROK family transcriptional regulator [Streptomyces abyssalis]OEU94034.1 ROK family transcriptional regulator [Streptomyces abyssalis]
MYRLDPRYAPAPQARLVTGWQAVSAELPQEPAVVAVDGPPATDWDTLRSRLAKDLSSSGTAVEVLDVRDHYAPAEVVVRRTVRPEDAGDPYYCKLADNSVEHLFGTVPEPAPPREGLLLICGPGAAVLAHDVLWYADVPKRHAEAAVAAGTGSNLGLPGLRGELRRLFYVDWPMLDRHRDALAPRVDAWLDVQEPQHPVLIDGDGLRATLAALARRPVRTRPYFNSTPWGGHWAQHRLGFNPDARNTALGYELIAPESGVLIGEGPGAQAEVPFQLLCVLHPLEMLGSGVHARYGTSFPIRFDYLDTVGGGNLSLHCHPRERYMRERFGWHYTQHETYYMTVGGPGTRVFLGLREDADVALFRKEVEEAVSEGTPMRPEDHVLTFPAEQGRLFMIPAGTPHASGAGNLVLEISATPYLYSLRFYDWLRPDADGNPRPLPYEHGLANLDTWRRGEDVARDLVPRPRTLRTGDGWREEVVGALEEMFYEVRRLVLDGTAAAEDDTDGRFHVLNVVEGQGVTVETANGHRHPLAHAETLTVPAAVGPYRLRPAGGGPAKVVKALVRPEDAP